MCTRRSLPLTLYVPTDYPGGRGELWWLALEEVVRRAQDGIELCRNGELWHLPAATLAELARVVRPPAAQAVPAIPLEPAAGILGVDPALLLPV